MGCGFGSIVGHSWGETDPSEDQGTEGNEEACQAPSPPPQGLLIEMSKP